MPKRSAPRQQLAQHMDARRSALGKRWADVAADAGLTTEGLRTIRKSDADIRPLSKQGIERALGWAQGSVDAILAGGEPTLINVMVGRDTESPLRSQLYVWVGLIDESDLLDAVNALAPLVNPKSREGRSQSEESPGG